MKTNDLLRDYSHNEVRDCVNSISGVDLFNQHPGKFGLVIEHFLREHPEGNSAEFVQWYRHMREDIEFQHRLA